MTTTSRLVVAKTREVELTALIRRCRPAASGTSWADGSVPKTSSRGCEALAELSETIAAIGRAASRLASGDCSPSREAAFNLDARMPVATGHGALTAAAARPVHDHAGHSGSPTTREAGSRTTTADPLAGGTLDVTVAAEAPGLYNVGVSAIAQLRHLARRRDLHEPAVLAVTHTGAGAGTVAPSGTRSQLPGGVKITAGAVRGGQVSILGRRRRHLQRGDISIAASYAIPGSGIHGGLLGTCALSDTYAFRSSWMPSTARTRRPMPRSSRAAGTAGPPSAPGRRMPRTGLGHCRERAGDPGEGVGEQRDGRGLHPHRRSSGALASDVVAAHRPTSTCAAPSACSDRASVAEVVVNVTATVKVKARTSPRRRP